MTMHRLPVLCLLLLSTPAAAEFFVDFGASVTRLESKIALRTDAVSVRDVGPGLGIGGRRQVGERSDIGARLEVERVDANLLLAVRALDFRRHLTRRFAIGAFLGAARLDLATPAYGYYAGLGVQWKDVRPSLDLGMDLRYGDKVARDNLLPSDPQGGSPDNFHDITGVRVYLSWRF